MSHRSLANETDPSLHPQVHLQKEIPGLWLSSYQEFVFMTVAVTKYWAEVTRGGASLGS